MTTASLNPDTRAKLMRVSTATLCTALYKRGFRNQTLQGVLPVNTNLQRQQPNMVGPAFTLRYIPAREDLNPISVFQSRTHPQRVAVEQCPSGAGGILISRLQARGCAGAVTDGGFRDSPEIAAMDFRAYHQRPSAPTNLTLHQALDINVPIGCGGVAVWPGDVMVGDNEAVVVIPAHLADELAAEATEMTVFEDFVMHQVTTQARSIIGLYPPTDPGVADEFKAWRERAGR
jgi:regulator of RNase E activity RraA